MEVTLVGLKHTGQKRALIEVVKYNRLKAVVSAGNALTGELGTSNWRE